MSIQAKRPLPPPAAAPSAAPRTAPAGGAATRPIRLGLRANLAQFGLLVAVNALVGGMLGQERTVLPLLADQVFHLSAYTGALTYILAFGATKAVTNFFAGTLSDRYGRRPVLIAGWLVALPIPAMLAWGPTWGWIVAANMLLGVNQGLTWSTTVIMKIDLVGPARRGLAMGLNEAAGYLAVAVTATATGAIAAQWGLRPQPFLLGAAYVALGLGLTVAAVRETREHARAEAAAHAASSGTPSEGTATAGAAVRAVDATPDSAAAAASESTGTAPAHGGPDDPARFSTARIARITSLGDRALSAASWAGMVNNLNDALAWGIFPLLYAAHGLELGRIGILAALYPAVWGAGQMLTGWWSDRIGRKHLITAGMLLQAAALGLVAVGTSFPVWAAAQALLGAGTALVYPTLLAVVGDVAHPAWRARAVGIYRLWRDGGFAVGALLAGILADAYGVTTAIWAVAALTAAAGVTVAVRMYETHPRN
ncbi:MFS transporter [Kitasatospora sp. CB01950]|uniref:MFS transporter n=1 Tax=Kitasatospora sp. CB01950 TaxID=1703930 RepID=UPI000967A625|nr:MFS transporter [Kitasatospora sp. CB01950]OKJ13967.1 MFS transporter [Kitasatospora sp. CB01950]